MKEKFPIEPTVLIALVCFAFAFLLAMAGYHFAYTENLPPLNDSQRLLALPYHFLFPLFQKELVVGGVLLIFYLTVIGLPPLLIYRFLIEPLLIESQVTEGLRKTEIEENALNKKKREQPKDKKFF